MTSSTLVFDRKRLARDKRSVPHPGQPVPYVVVSGAPGVPLFTLVREPHQVFDNESLQLNGGYYVTKLLLPTLHRVLSLMKIDVYKWFRQLPRRPTFQNLTSNSSKVITSN